MNNLIRVVVPLLLGLAAGLVNFVVVRGLAEPKYLVAASVDLKPDSEITNVNDNSQIVRFTVRTENNNLFKSAVPWSERGVLLHRKVTRSIAAGEAVFYTDVKSEGTDNVQSQLKPDEISYTFTLRQSRIVPGVKIGDQIVIVTYEEGVGADGVAGNENRKVVGPYRVVASIAAGGDAFRSGTGADDFRKLSVAVTRSDEAALNKLSIQLDSANGRTHVEFQGKSGK